MITVSDGTNSASSTTYTTTVTDENDQTPAVSVASTYSHTEAASTTFQTYTIVDTDTAGTYACSLGGTDAADFSASISGKVCTVVWAANPDYENPADSGGNNVYDITVSFTDGTNALSAQTTAITVVDANDQTPTYTAGSTTQTVNEGSSANIGSFALTDSDTGNSFSCTESGADAGDFTCSISGSLVTCLLYTSPSPRDLSTSRMPSSA